MCHSTLSRNIDLATKSLFEIQLSLSISSPPPTCKYVAMPMLIEVNKPQKFSSELKAPSPSAKLFHLKRRLADICFIMYCIHFCCGQLMGLLLLHVAGSSDSSGYLNPLLTPSLLPTSHSPLLYATYDLSKAT